MNYKYGSHPDAKPLFSDYYLKAFTQSTADGCWLGCTMACSKGIDGFQLRTGPYKGQIVTVDGPEYETIAGCGSNMGVFDPLWVSEYNYYCDTYGLDTISFGTGMAFVMECYEAGILNKDITGGLELKFGNAEAAAELLHRTARGEGFGLVFGQGIRRMKKIFAEEYGAIPVPPRHWHGIQRHGVFRVHYQRVAGDAGRLWLDAQGAAARRGLADLYGHGQKPDPDL